MNPFGDMKLHERGCPMGRAVQCAVGVECEHGYDVCPQCDPCTCPPSLSLRARIQLWIGGWRLGEGETPRFHNSIIIDRIGTVRPVHRLSDEVLDNVLLRRDS